MRVERVYSKADLEEKWSRDIISNGYTVVPNLLIKNLKPFNINPAEFTIIIAIESFRWTTEYPFPSVRLISDMTGMAERTIMKHTAVLQKKGLLKKIHRSGRSNLYSIEPLIRYLDQLA